MFSNRHTAKGSLSVSIVCFFLTLCHFYSIRPAVLLPLDHDRHCNCEGVRQIQADDSLPLIPKTLFPSLNFFFSNYTSRGGWIDVGALPITATEELRRIASDIMTDERKLECGYPRVNVTSIEGGGKTQTIIPKKDKDLKYCFWEKDVVSSHALNDFHFEQPYWEWVAKSFEKLAISYPAAMNSAHCCKRFAFLDIGVNVGDWISPIRLLAPPTVPIFGVEGSPATAALASANLHTSALHTTAQSGEETCSKLLPFSMAASSQIPTIRSEGGICFSRVKETFVGGRINQFNLGGRFVDERKSIDECQAQSDIAGATTLQNALESLCPRSSLPKVYILKIDVEGFEFKAISSVVSSWLSMTPPCYFVMEFWNKHSYIALIQTLITAAGYDAVWRPWAQEFPGVTPPWLSHLTGNQDNIETIVATKPKGYMELIFGFSDVDKCINSLINLV